MKRLNWNFVFICARTKTECQCACKWRLTWLVQSGVNRPWSNCSLESQGSRPFSWRYTALGLKNHADAWTVGLTATSSLCKCSWGKQKNPNCTDRLLIRRDQKPSWPIWSREDVTQTWAVLLEYYQHVISFQAPMWRERQEVFTVNEVESSRERTPEYCTTSNSGRCCGGVRARKQRSEGGHYRPFFGETVFSFFGDFFAAPKLRKGGSQNNVQPLVSPWSWDYTLLLPEDTGAVWRSFSHTCWVSPAAFTCELQGSGRINIPRLRQR